ncbi:MAG: hypothetical protein RI909_172, partial [Bacteroidota bacterium]
MLTVFLSIVMITFSQSSFRISETPIFKSAADSIAFAKVNQVYRTMMMERHSAEELDSVFMMIQELSKKGITGYRKVYQPSPHYFPFDSLLLISHYDQVVHLSMDKKAFRKLPDLVFQCKNLQSLELVNTRLKRLPRKLKLLPKLESIYVLNNKPLHKLKLGKNETVKSLVFRGQNPSWIPSSFQAFKNLEKLDLAANELTSFPAGTSHNKKLKELILNNNYLTLEKDQLKLHSSLEKLDIQRNKINAIPSSIQKFPNLKRLSLNFNAIEKVSDDISSLTKLEQLSFYNNKLTAIPEGVYALSNLREIDLYFNQIERLDDRFANLKALEVLFISNNRLISVSEAMGTMTNLKALYLSNNRLSDLPKSLGNLSDLKVLRINNNYLAQVPS